MDVYLVCLPIGECDAPMLSLSLLKSCLAKEKLSSYVHYGNLEFSQMLGQEVYRALGQIRSCLFLGEAIFAQAAGNMADGKRQQYGALVEEYYANLIETSTELGKLYYERNRKQVIAAAQKAMEMADSFLTRLTAEIVASGAPIVGICDMFQQTNATMALAKRLKAAQPNLTIIVGGASCMNEAGRAFVDEVPEIDYVFSGEADECFAELCRKLLRGEKTDLPYGVMYRGDGGAVPYRLTQDMNKVPVPDFTDYFAQVKQYGIVIPEILGRLNMHLLAEGSRGCWWGEKHPCTFCGLNGKAHTYRDKTPERVRDELVELSRTYGLRRFFFTDCILSLRQLRELPQLLKEVPEKLEIFVEIKSNLTKEQLQDLAQAGFIGLQPGIESLEDHFLTAMHKGNRAIKHVEILKHMTQLRMDCAWNLLGGFPEEEDSWYETLYETVSMLGHLQPPNLFSHIIYERDDEYFLHPEKYGLTIRYARAYDYVWPESKHLKENMAYMFEPEEESKLTNYYHIQKRNPLLLKLYQRVETWRQHYFASLEHLFMEDKGECLEIMDTRDCAVHCYLALTGLKRELYLACSETHSLTALKELFAEKYPADAIAQALTEFVADKIMLQSGEEYLSLALCAG